MRNVGVVRMLARILLRDLASPAIAAGVIIGLPSIASSDRSVSLPSAVGRYAQCQRANSNIRGDE